MSVYGHCRPGVEAYDSWERGSKEKHTTHLSSTQEELTIKVVERPPMETDGAYYTFIITFYTREMVQEFLPTV